MTTLYKLTNCKHQTYNGCQWGENVTHMASGGDMPLCTENWLHAYTHPVLALLLNPIHARTYEPVLWICEGRVGKTDHGLKVGCTSLTTLRTMPLPVITAVNRIAFAIGCAANVYHNSHWTNWARNWILNNDRNAYAAADAADAAYAADAAAYAAADAANAAAYADAAAYAAADADAANAAAYAAADAAYAAELPLGALAEWAMTIK